MSRPSLVLVALSLLLGGVGCSKYQTLSKTSLDATAPLTIAFEGDLSNCEVQLCLLAIAHKHGEVSSKAVKLEEGSKLVRVQSDGSWTAFEAGDSPEKEEKPEPPEDWREQPILDAEVRIAESVETQMGNAVKEVATGQLVEMDGKRLLEISPELLPAGDFMIYTNGWFGARYEDERLSSPTRFGVTKISR